MAVLDVIIGYVRGLKGDTGATGATGATGPGATVSVGTVTTTTYGNPASVTNSGTETDAVLDFVIPQGAPGEEVTDVSSLTLDSVTSTAASFPIPAVGEVMSVIMGKIIKFFSDTVTALNAKLNRSDVTTSLGVTTTGQALDATAGKTLNDSISALNDSFTNKITGMYVPTLGSYATVDANVWEYTGFTITVPENHLYIGEVFTGWSQGQPLGLGINPSQTLTGNVPQIAEENGETVFQTPALFMYPATWYVFVKRASAGTNNYYARYIDIAL